MNPNPEIDLSQASAGADAIGTAIADFIFNNCVSCILAVLGAVLSIWLIFRLIKYIRNGDLIYVDDVDAHVVKDYKTGAWDGADP